MSASSQNGLAQASTGEPERRRAPDEPTTRLAPDAPVRRPAPEFAVLGAAAVEHAAAPTLRFSLGVSEPDGGEIYTIALHVQIQLEPAKRSYDTETRELLAELFGAPERWAATTHSFAWAAVDVLVPSFSGSGTFELSLPCTYDLELAAAKYLYALPDGVAPLAMHFSGSVFYPAQDGRMQMVQVPWTTSADYGLPVATWRAMMAAHYPDRGWVALSSATLRRLYRRKVSSGARTFDDCVAQLLDGVEPTGQGAGAREPEHTETLLGRAADADARER